MHCLLFYFTHTSSLIPSKIIARCDNAFGPLLLPLPTTPTPILPLSPLDIPSLRNPRNPVRSTSHPSHRRRRVLFPFPDGTLNCGKLRSATLTNPRHFICIICILRDVPADSQVDRQKFGSR